MNSQNTLTHFERMYAENYRHVLFYVNRICGDMETAEDVTQEAFLQAQKSYHTYDPERGQFIHWIKKIAKNKYLRSEIKNERCEMNTDRVVRESDSRTPAEISFEENSVREILLKSIEKLPEPERSIVNYKYKNKMKLDEIAQKINSSRRNVSRKYLNALTLLRFDLKKEDLLPAGIE